MDEECTFSKRIYLQKRIQSELLTKQNQSVQFLQKKPRRKNPKISQEYNEQLPIAIAEEKLRIHYWRVHISRRCNAAALIYEYSRERKRTERERNASSCNRE